MTKDTRYGTLGAALCLIVIAFVGAAGAAGPTSGGVACVDGNTLDGDCCSAAGIQEESRFGFTTGAPGVINSRATGCLNAATNVCEDGIDNDGDGLVDSEDEECTTFNEIQRQAVLAYDATARQGLRMGSEVKIAHHLASGSAPDPNQVFMAGVCDGGLCACPDTLAGGDPNDPNMPGLSRPGCAVAGAACTTNADCLPAPYPAGQSHAGICGINVTIRRQSTVEGNVAATGNVRFGRGFVASQNLVNLGGEFFCDGCIERINGKTPQPNVRLDGEAPWTGPGMCYPSASMNCYSNRDCCLEDLVTCFAPAQPGDLCRARLPFDFLDANDPNHNPNVTLTGGTLDPNDPNSLCNDYDRCLGALAAVDRLRDDSGDPASLGSSNLPGAALTSAPAVFGDDRIFIRSADSARLTFVGGGTHVRDVDLINMRRAATLEIEAERDAVLVLRVLRNLRIGGENVISLIPPDPNDPNNVISPDSILWVLDDRRGSIFISRDVDLPGTVVAPRRRKIKVGGDTTITGALIGEEVDLRGDIEVRHQPFIPLLPTNLSIAKTGVPDPQNVDAPAGVVVAGEDILYTIDVTNNGPSVAPGAVLTDTLPPEVTFNSVNITQGNGSCEYVLAAHTVLCYLGTLDREDDPSTGVVDNAATIEIQVTTLADTRGTVTNNAIVNANVEQSVSGNNSIAQDTTVIGISDLNVISKVDAPDPAVAGQASALVYTIEIENLGPSDAFEADPPGVQLTDVIPSNLTIVSATHQPGDGGASQPCGVAGNTVTCDMGRVDVINTAPGGTEPNPEVVTITVTPDCDAHLTHPPASKLSNTATVSNAGELDPDGANDSSSTTTGFVGEVDLSSSKSDSVSGGVGYVIAGESMIYTVNVANGGPSDATNVSFTDVLPAGVAFNSGSNCSSTGGTPYVDEEVTCTIASIGCSSAANRNITVDVRSDVVDSTIVTNNVTGISQDETEVGAGDETSSTNTTVRRRANLAITKTRTSPVGNCVPGQTVSYDLVVTNSGSSDATGATVTDAFPTELSNCSWTCATVGTASCAAAGAGNISESVDIAAGGGNSVTFSVTCDIDPSARGTNGNGSGDLDNTASVAKEAAALADPVAGNNSASDSCTLAPSADLTLSQSDAGSDPVTAGDASSLVYVLTIDNAGPSDAIDGNVILTDTLDSGVTYVSAIHSGGGSCGEAGGVVTCNLGTIDVADAAETVTITVTPDCDTRTSVTNNAQIVTGGEADPGTPNASAEGTTVNEDVTLSISKIGDVGAIEETVDTLTYTIQVDNNATHSCALNTTVTDTLDSDLENINISSSQGGCSSFPCNLGTINAGANATVTVTATAVNGSAAQNDATFNEVTNSASVDSDEAEGAQVSGTVTTDVQRNQGDACTLTTDCAAGSCVDGVCCESACGTLCQACDNAHTGQADGLCRDIIADLTDDEPAPPSCAGTTGCADGSDCVCNGSSGGGSCLGDDGATCTADANCVSGMCECADAACSTRVCSAVACGCQFNSDGDGTCDGNLTNGTDPGDECGTCAACSGGACTDHAANSDPDTDCGFCQSCNGAGACGNTADSFDPHDDCPVGAADCCDGAGACGGSACSE